MDPEMLLELEATDELILSTLDEDEVPPNGVPVTLESSAFKIETLVVVPRVAIFSSNSLIKVFFDLSCPS